MKLQRLEAALGHGFSRPELLFQALTQIQEMTLVFVPKIIAIFAALLIFLPLMGALLAGFANEVFARIAEF